MSRTRGFALSAIYVLLVVALVLPTVLLAHGTVVDADSPQPSGLIQGTQTRLIDFFPKTTNGENGIYLQYLAADGSYVNLTYWADYAFHAPGYNRWNIPDVEAGIDYIQAHPCAPQNGGNLEADAIVRVTLNGDYGVVRVSGRAWIASWGDVRHYIYKGANNYGAPLWQTWSSDESFDLMIPYTAGDELFFATDSGSSPFNDWARWDIYFQGGVNEGHDGSIAFNMGQYSDLDKGPTITVTDPDLNTNPSAPDPVDVTVRSFDNVTRQVIDTKDIRLWETGDDTGVFTGGFSFLTGDHAGDLIVVPQHDGVLTATYVDELDSQGNANSVRVAEATYQFYLKVTTSTKPVLGPGMPDCPLWSDSATVQCDIDVSLGDHPVMGAEVFLDGVSKGTTGGAGNVTLEFTDGLDQTRQANVSAYWEDPTWNTLYYGETDNVKLWESTSLRVPMNTQLDGYDYAEWVDYFVVKQLKRHLPLTVLHLLPKSVGWAVDLYELFDVIHEMSTNYNPREGDYIRVADYEITTTDPAAPCVWATRQSVQRDGETIVDNWYWTCSQAAKDFYIQRPLLERRHMVMRMDSPAVLYITAPDGSHAGYDPATGQLVSDFPIAISNPGDEPFSLVIPNPQAGEYTVSVVGTGSGNYTLHTQGFDSNGNAGRESVFQGNINAGEIHTYHVTGYSPPNVAPAVEAGGPYLGSEGSPITLDASASHDPDGTIALYEWDFDGDGVFEVSSTSPALQHTWADDFTGVVTLRVTDNDGLTSTDTTQVTVSNVPPVVNAGPDQGTYGVLSVAFSGSFTDPGADTHTISWDFGDGATATGTLTPTHVYASGGVYTVTLTVTDDNGGVGTDTVIVNTLQNDMGTGGDAYNTANTSYGSENATVLTQTASGTGFVWYKTASGPDRYDEYKIPVNYRDTVTITFTPPAGSTGVDLLIFGADKYILLTVSNITTQTSRQVTACCNGYIYFMIKADNTSDVGIYGVTISVTSNPDNDMGTGGDAFNTGNINYGNENATLLTQTASGTGFIWYRNSTGPDYCDEYRVPVSAGQVVTITFTPPAGSTGIDLLFFGTNKSKVMTLANVTSQVTQKITASGNGYIYFMIKADTVSDVGIYSLSVSVS